MIFSLGAFSCDWLNPVQESGPIVCFTFDDQNLSVYEQALPIMREYGFPATSFVNSGRVGLPALMDWAQIIELEQVYGWETGGHSLQHENLAELSYEQAAIAIGADYQNLIAQGLHPKGFALPSGSCPAEYYPLITRYYEYIRGSTDVAMQEPVNLLNLGYLPFQTGWTAEQIIARIEQGISRGEALIVIGFHNVGSGGEANYGDCPVGEFRRIMSYTWEKSLPVLTLSEALERL